MDKKFDYIIERNISEQNSSFKLFLKEFLLDQESWWLLLQISNQTNVYVFSGVIRNFLLGYSENRDLDIVVKHLDKIVIPTINQRKIQIKKNSFGGYKLKIGMLNVDVWDIEKTWGIQNMRLSSTPYSLIKTAFFNFSAIVYDFNRGRFIYDKCFVDFYKTHAMDIQYKENPNIPLCIVNSFYYALKYSFSIKYELCKWIVNNYNENIDFREIQLRHFHNVIFDAEKVYELVSICSKSLSTLEKNKTYSALKF